MVNLWPFTMRHSAFLRNWSLGIRHCRAAEAPGPYSAAFGITDPGSNSDLD